MPIPKKNTSQHPQTARQRIYTTLKEWIIDGTLKPEEKISDMEIAEYFSVSRTPVREAMQLLADQKLIEIFPGKESRVSAIDWENAGQVYIMLSELQAVAMQFAFPKLSNDIIERLEKINNEMEKALQNDYVEVIRNCDNSFHDVILELSGNNFLINFNDILRNHVMRIENLYYSSQKKHISSVKEHEQIIEALKCGDLESAKEAMRKNWLHAMEVVGLN
ncbi:MAG: GntR family transcriptional regulator [Anaerovoracaceae bacterium]